MQPAPKEDVSAFELGQIVITATALEILASAAVMDAIDRHASGDWGDLPEEDVRSNERALQVGGRLFSAYDSGGTRFWIITEADRSATTILLPEDY